MNFTIYSIAADFAADYLYPQQKKQKKAQEDKLCPPQIKRKVERWPGIEKWGVMSPTLLFW